MAHSGKFTKARIHFKRILPIYIFGAGATK